MALGNLDTQSWPLLHTIFNKAAHTPCSLPKPALAPVILSGNTTHPHTHPTHTPLSPQSVCQREMHLFHQGKKRLKNGLTLSKIEWMAGQYHQENKINSKAWMPAGHPDTPFWTERSFPSCPRASSAEDTCLANHKHLPCGHPAFWSLVRAKA